MVAIRLRFARASLDRYTDAQRARLRQSFERGDIEIRKVESRQIFVGGEPVGEPFE